MSACTYIKRYITSRLKRFLSCGRDNLLNSDGFVWDASSAKLVVDEKIIKT